MPRWLFNAFFLAYSPTLRSLPTESVEILNGCFLYSFSCNS
nr:MAG TPA: hypothetical protein [Caudoviricetes sp.]